MNKEKNTISTEDFKKGIYQHYKGGKYRVLNEVKNSESKEDMLVYQDINDETKIWVRPKLMFLELVDIKGEKKPRFEFLKEEENDNLESKYLRALADYHNLLKQTARDKEEFLKYALANFLEDILPVYDHLKMSLNGLKDDEHKNPWVEGVKYVLKQFKDVLESKGIEEIKTVGEKFDHETMEALDGTGDNVKQEVMAGYKLKGKVIRHAKVIVE
jgi:molecular chaperone GrpE